MSQVNSQYERGCAVLARHIFIIIDDMQYKQGTLSVLERVCSISEAYLQ